jgi:Domain of unknown function (DUF4251)
MPVGVLLNQNSRMIDMKFVATLILLVSLGFAGHAQQDKKELKNQQKAEQYLLLKDLVQSGSYEFKALRAIPQKGRQIDLATRDNFMRIKDGRASADLPFFGRAFSASIASADSGIKFDGTPENYEVEENDKKQSVIIKFRIRAKAENFDCTLSISSSSASLIVISSQRSTMNYNGTVTKFPADN